MTITLGIATAIIALGFLAVPAMPGTSRWGIYGAALFCGMIALACLAPWTRPVSLRLVTATIFVGCVLYLIDAVRTPGAATGPTRSKLLGAVSAFVCFGLPAAVITVIGPHGRWLPGSGSRMVNDTAAAHSKPIFLTWRRLPANARFVVDGFMLDRAEWEEIMSEVATRVPADKPSLWVRLISNLGFVFLLALLIVVTLKRIRVGVLPAIGVMLATFIWYFAWRWPRSRGSAVRWQILAERGYPICVACGYNLTGSGADGPCPECGWRRDATSASSSSAPREF